MTDFYSKLPDALLPWFASHARELPWRADREPYHVWLSEIMLQQTRVEAVKSYYTRFLSVLPTIAALADAEPATLQKLWEGLGYYTRMRNLQKAAQVIVREHGGIFPTEYSAVRALPGIGDYTAGAICSICFEQPTPAVDGNVLRVISRVGECYDPIDAPQTKKEVTQALQAVYPTGQCGAFTQALMELGAIVCLPNGAPKCAECPAAGFCASRIHGTQAELPVKKPKKARRHEELTVFVLQNGSTIATQPRPESGLLAGLNELPNVPGHLTAQEALDLASQWGIHPTALTREVEKTHIFTHVEWQMRAFYIACAEPAPQFQWHEPKQVALPTAFRIFLDQPSETEET
jgi:A/G-specific adenine glycosylase